MQTKDFLEKCKSSSTSAYEALKELLAHLDDDGTRLKARSLLADLEDIYFETNDEITFSQTYHFKFEKLAIQTSSDNEETLTLIQLPSVFAPEEWSFTFFEGLARYPVSEFQGRTVAELGTGNGWISIALAKRTLPAVIYGLDINPRAITCARLNLYLNALSRSGERREDSEGKTLLERVQFHVSNLLEYCRARGMQLDKVVGCIPQVLSPDPKVARRIVRESESDDFLYSLSNYCSKQGYIEDQFGLGLIAKATEEAVDVLKPSGKVVFNLGGRPGTAVLQRLFRRRGFQVKKIWETKVLQAADTDIEPLVEIERHSPHRFEFFMGLQGNEAMSAKTASAYADAGGQISHALMVLEGTLLLPAHVKKILQLLKQPEFEDVRSALDLSFEDSSLADEKLPFLADLADKVTKNALPYGETRGEIALRRRLAEFLRSYHRIPASAKNFIVAPTRQALVSNVFHIYMPRIALVDKEAASSLPSEWLERRIGDSKGPVIIETPRRADGTCQLIEKLSPQIVVTSLADFEQKTADAFVRLIESSRKQNCRLFVDISQLFELSSTPQANGVFEYLSGNELPQHVTLYCGLVRNRVYADLELCFAYSENETLLTSLVSAAELTYSRTPLLSQWYYDRILFDLLSFQMPIHRQERSNLLRIPREESAQIGASFVGISDSANRAFKEPAICELEVAGKSSLRLDYGENSLPPPALLKRAFYESFARQHVRKAETDPTLQLGVHLASRYGIEVKPTDHVVFGGGVAPLFSGLAFSCAQEDGKLFFPSGSYGYFNAAAEMMGCRTATIETHEKNFFKVTPKELHAAIRGTPEPWIYLNAPVVNPTGAIYSESELHELFKVAIAHKAKVILDTVFSGLEFQGDSSPRLSFLSDVASSEFEFILLGGISKEFAAGGIRLGYAYTASITMASAVKKQLFSEPHKTVKLTFKKILEGLEQKDPSLVADIGEQRLRLGRRALLLERALQQKGWNVITPHGGLFLVAKPKEPRSVQALSDAGISINSPEWTGLPGFYRFVLSVDEKTFQAALEKIEKMV